MKNALGHIAMGLLLAVIFTLIALCFLPWRQALLCGWALQSAYWLGRERRDEEIVRKYSGAPITHGWDALKGWNIFTWTVDGRKDLLAPVLVIGAIVAVVLYGAHR